MSADEVVVVAHDVDDSGGMERAVAEVVRRNADAVRFHVVSTRLAPDLRGRVVWHRIRVPRRPILLKFSAFYLLAGMRLHTLRGRRRYALGALVPNRIDVAAVHFCQAGWAALRAPRSDVITLPRRLHALVYKRLTLIAERWSYRPSHVGVLAPVSEGLGGELRRHYPSVPAAVVPNGVDVERFAAAPNGEARAALRADLGAAPEDAVALFVGGDWGRKGLDVAIGAVRVARERGASVQLWIVGRGDEDRAAAHADRLGVCDSVRFLGPRPDPERFCRAADVFLLPSLYETFSLVAHEAAAAGLPLVATRVHGVDELLDAGGGIEARADAEAFGAALARLASDEELRRRMGRAGQAAVATRTWERSAELTLDLLRAANAGR